MGTCEDGGVIPTPEDLASLADLSVPEALEAIEARGLVPVGWSSDPLRAWWCVACVGLGARKQDIAIEGATKNMITVAIPTCPTCCGARVTQDPATTADLLAVLATDHATAEHLAREVAGVLREHGYSNDPRKLRVVWQVVLPGTHKPRTVWRNGETCMTPEGHVGIVGYTITPASQLPAARALVTMGLHLGTVADDAVTLVRVRPA